MVNFPALGWINCTNCGQPPSAKCKCTDCEHDDYDMKEEGDK